MLFTSGNKILTKRRHAVRSVHESSQKWAHYPREGENVTFFQLQIRHFPEHMFNLSEIAI